MGNFLTAPHPPTMLYEIQDIKGKGKGLIATEKITKGTRLLSEKPILMISGRLNKSLSSSIQRLVEALSENHRKGFLALHSTYVYNNDIEQYMGILRTNCLPCGDSQDIGVICLDACRINHSCDHNTVLSWNENTQLMNGHALKDIDKGEEITISYTSNFWLREERLNHLLEHFKFICSCRFCSLPPEQSRRHDKTLRKIMCLYDVAMGSSIKITLETPVSVLRQLERLIQLVKEKNPEIFTHPGLYSKAADTAIANSDFARGYVFRERAATIWKEIAGQDSPMFLKAQAMLLNPYIFKSCGMSRQWMTSLADIPTGLEPDAFEKWLWRKGNKAAIQSCFSSFLDLPHEHTFEPDFYKGTRKHALRPLRHWCFLGSITAFNNIFRLYFQVEDLDGSIISVFFHTPSRGLEVENPHTKIGDTIAVLYPVFHLFMDGRAGIRLENPQMFKIFSLSMKKINSLSNKVQEFSLELDGVRKCHGCEKKAATLNRCSKCLSFWYCNKTCQIEGWNKHNHGADCKHLKDPDLRGLLVRNWDTFNGMMSFPMAQ